MLNSPRVIEAYEATALWTQLLDTLLHSADVARSAPRGASTRELLNVTLRLRDGYRCAVQLPERRLNYQFMVAEWMWIALGCEDVASIAHYNKAIARFSDDGRTFYGAYGPRWVSQLPYVVQKLRTDHESRQAVASIWRPSPPSTKDVPCTVAMQYLVRGGQLHAIVTMRSSDVWLGVPYDVFNFSMLANIVAGELGLPLGEVRIQLGSSHMYEENVDAAYTVLAAHRADVREAPTLPQLPGQFPNGDAKLWWRMAQVGHVATAIEPWFEFLTVLASRASPDAPLYGPIGEMIEAQRARAAV